MGNLEENLARLNYSVLRNVRSCFAVIWPYKKSGMIADIIVPAEMLMEPVDVIVRKHPKEFRDGLMICLPNRH